MMVVVSVQEDYPRGPGRGACKRGHAVCQGLGGRACGSGDRERSKSFGAQIRLTQLVCGGRGRFGTSRWGTTWSETLRKKASGFIRGPAGRKGGKGRGPSQGGSDSQRATSVASQAVDFLYLAIYHWSDT
jgi:hypothetical protein